MKFATNTELRQLDLQAARRREEIRSSEDCLRITGTVYYVSSDGCDESCGTDISHPWRTLEKVSAFPFREGDAVLFRRGDVFRGQVFCRSGVTYGAYGSGEKPRVYGWTHDLADASLWECTDEAHHLYHLRERIPDCGTLVFNSGERHSYKHIPSWIGGRFVCRDKPERAFIPSEEMTGDLDLFCSCTEKMTTQESHGETWPVPQTGGDNPGDLYLRCDAGNPGAVFDSIEALPGRHTFIVGNHTNVHIDNLCIKYCGAHAIFASGGKTKGLHVTNCEIGWVGGTIQHYLGTDPNYPQGTRGTVTRFGNGIESGGCEDYLCKDNYIYQVYDAGVTHQTTVSGGETCIMKNVRYTGNLIENCVYSIEYFLANTHGTDSLMDGLEIDHNILRFSGCGWGQQRHNVWTGAHIKSWCFENPARNYRIHDNVFDRAAYRLLHLCCERQEDYPLVDNNTYIQTLGCSLGQFGPCAEQEAPVIAFMENADREVGTVIGDRHAKVLWVNSL